MAKCSRCGRVYREPPGEEGDHPCECSVTRRWPEDYDDVEDRGFYWDDDEDE